MKKNYTPLVFEIGFFETDIIMISGGDTMDAYFNYDNSEWL